MYIVIGEYKEVSLFSKTDGHDVPNNIYVDVLILLCCSWLGVAIVLFLGFCTFAAIVDELFCIVDEFNIVICKMFLQRGKVQMAKFLVPKGER